MIAIKKNANSCITLYPVMEIAKKESTFFTIIPSSINNDECQLVIKSLSILYAYVYFASAERFEPFDPGKKKEIIIINTNKGIAYNTISLKKSLLLRFMIFFFCIHIPNVIFGRNTVRDIFGGLHGREHGVVHIVVAVHAVAPY